MSQCQSGSDTYLNFKCYEFLKPRYDKIDLGVYGPQSLAEVTEKIKKHHNNIKPYEDFFKNITSYLKDSGVFYYADRRIPCTYVNYLLNKKVIKDDMHLKNPNYQILKDFVKEYHLNEGSGHRAASVCSSEIKSLANEVYNKMTALYDLYDKYITLVGSKKPENYDPCNILSMIISYYNYSIRHFEATDKNLINKLIELKKLIDINVLPKNTNCLKTIDHFSLSEKEKFDIEEEKRIKREEEQKLAEKERLEQEQQRLAQEKQQLEQEQLKRDELQRPPQPEHLDSEEQRRQVQTGLVRPDSNEQRQQYQIPIIQRTLLPYNKENGLAEPYNSQSFGESENSRIKMEQLQDPGLLGQMQNTFSSIVQNVDPAPVLGVSGGMGVLFILFKYTPFGSFFGGRRRRMHQIPSSFRGFPPGEFPNFHEYDGGFIGYAPMNINPLAE